MKKRNIFNSKSTKSVFLTVFLVVTTVSSTYANWFYSHEKTFVADQHAYSNTCVKVYHVVVKVFGITISDEMEEEPYDCNNPVQSDPPIEG